MKEYIEQRVLQIAGHILKTGATVRSAAKVFKISKSTVHKDISERLKELNPQLYNKVSLIMQLNKDERHLRGGEATRNKYKQTT